MEKTFLVGLLAVFAASSAAAQVQVDVRLEKVRYLVGEPVVVVATVKNIGAQPLPYFQCEGEVRLVDQSSRSYAALGLGQIGGDRAVEYLKGALEASPSDAVRSSIATALGNTKSRAAVPLLSGMFNERFGVDVCGPLMSLTHRTWCDGTGESFSGIRAEWLRRWNELGSAAEMFGTDNCPAQNPPAAGPGQSTPLTLTFETGDGQPVSVTSAQLLVTAWGSSHKYDLNVEKSVVNIDLEATRPAFEGKVADLRGYMYIKAAGYAPLMSQPFSWPTTSAPALIDFRNDRSVAVEQGAGATLTVRLRPPVARQIRLIDNDGRAVRRAEVKTAAYWNTPNHCGFFNGTDTLSTGVTNDEGILEIPDLDGTYALFLADRHLVFTAVDRTGLAGLPWQGLVTALDQTETRLRVRRHRQQRLVVDVLDGGKPLPGAVLWSDMALGVCGAGYGPLATSDARGRIRQNAFYPEEWRNFWVCARGKQAWVLPEGGRLPAKIDVSVTPSAEQNALASVCVAREPR